MLRTDRPDPSGEKAGIEAHFRHNPDNRFEVPDNNRQTTKPCPFVATIVPIDSTVFGRKII